ncbi:MAG: hypothetical protein IJ437_02955 [Clostridia bacterium]|nr:hypothetical protein [Clostridia bacterium]
MCKKVYIGIDTSNYTTSCAVCNEDGIILENYKALLPVKEGENGLRQSDAVFAHVKNFELISSYIKEKHADYEIIAIGYSAYPRDCENSYMPCFLVGKAVAQMISALYNIDIYKFSHQMGHIQASIYSSGAQIDEDFIAFHVSGGTTEILHVTPHNNTYIIEQIGGSIDLHAGQAIDRIGVKMGMVFPCGKEMEIHAKENYERIPPIKSCVNGYQCNISGLENLALKLYSKTNNISLVSAYVFEFLSKTLIKLTENLRKEYKNKKIIFAGGVMSNSIIQNNLNNAFKNVYFAKPEFSADNAAGVAILTRKEHVGRE